MPLQGCPYLAYLDASWNKLTAIEAMPALPLRTLILNFNCISKLTLPELPVLIELLMQSNRLDKTVAWELAKLPALLLLDLEDNLIGPGARLEMLCYMPELKVYGKLLV